MSEANRVGIDIGDPAALGALAARTKEILGADWLEAAVGELDRYPVEDRPLLLVGFSKLTEWLSGLRAKQGGLDVRGVLQFGMLLWLINGASELPGSDAFYASLREAAKRMDWQAFYDKLFEAEVGVYWTNQSIGSAEFGPSGGNPDLWLSFPTPLGALRSPTECKRIRPISVVSEEQGRLCAAIRQWLEDPVNEAPPMKVSVLLHRPAAKGLSRSVCNLLAGLSNQIKTGLLGTEWLTVGDPRGSLQVSAARLGTAAEWQDPGAIVEDVDVSLGTSAQVDYQVDRLDGDQFRVRLKSIATVRSDIVFDSVGGLGPNVRTAIGQLAKLGKLTMPGIVAVRIRPPRSKSDLLEADLIVRQIFLTDDARHVAAAVLFWNQSEDLTSEAPAQQFAVYHLQSYFIVNALSGLNPVGLDSQPKYFPNLPGAVTRDPLTGLLIGTTQNQIEQIRTADDVEPSTRNALASKRDLSEETDAISLLIHLVEPLSLRPGGRLIGNVQAGNRQFRVFIDGKLYVRAIEIRDAQPVRVASIDMRAWMGREEFLFY